MRRSRRPPLRDSFNIWETAKERKGMAPNMSTELETGAEEEDEAPKHILIKSRGYGLVREPSKNGKNLPLPEMKRKRLEAIVPLVRLNPEDEKGALELCRGSAAATEVVRQEAEDLSRMRNLVSTILIHPNLLRHEDFDGLRRFLENLGVTYTCTDTAICIPVEPSDGTPLIKLHPALPKSEVPLLYSFGYIQDMTIDVVSKCVNVHKYSLMPPMKSALKRLLTSLYESPQLMYKPLFTFLYEFMIHFGAKPGSIDAFIKSRSSALNGSSKSRSSSKESSPKSTASESRAASHRSANITDRVSTKAIKSVSSVAKAKPKKK